MEQTVTRKERVYLTGFMGSGKSTIGPILANTIGFDFIDIDRTIELRTGKTVTQIFREMGEGPFRVLERGVITEICTRTDLVVSLGGGTVSDPDTLRLIMTTGILVYLKVTPEQLFRRLHHKTDRPLLSDEEGNRLPEPELRKRIRTLYDAREPLYAMADIIVPTDESRVGVTVDLIVKRLAPYLR